MPFSYTEWRPLPISCLLHGNFLLDFEKREKIVNRYLMSFDRLCQALNVELSLILKANAPSALETDMSPSRTHLPELFTARLLSHNFFLTTRRRVFTFSATENADSSPTEGFREAKGKIA
jgi:hypothetical protein